MEHGRPWHIWALAVGLAGALVALTWQTPAVLYGWTGLLVAATFFGTLFLLWKRGRPLRHTEDLPLATLDLDERALRVRMYPTQDALAHSDAIDFDEVEEILFASRRVSVGVAGLTSEGVGVFVRLYGGTVWPVISSTLERGPAYAVARELASRLEVRVKQVGVGWSDH